MWLLLLKKKKKKRRKGFLSKEKFVFTTEKFEEILFCREKKNEIKTKPHPLKKKKKNLIDRFAIRLELAGEKK